MDSIDFPIHVFITTTWSGSSNAVFTLRSSLRKFLKDPGRQRLKRDPPSQARSVSDPYLLYSSFSSSTGF